MHFKLSMPRLFKVIKSNFREYLYYVASAEYEKLGTLSFDSTLRDRETNIQFIWKQINLERML